MDQRNGPVQEPVHTSDIPSKTPLQNGVSRRRFFQVAGVLAGGSLLVESCRRSATNNVEMGKGDTALLNYLYIIAQLQAGFYTQAYATPYYNPSTTQLSEYQLVADLRDHQLAYVGLYQYLLGNSAISKVVLQMSLVNFSDRSSTLSNATTIQDLAVGAYAGAVQLFTNTKYIQLFAKMASVEARHAGYVRDALNYNTFGDGTVIDANGLGQALPPHTVIPLIQNYIQTTFDFSGVPSF
jgi:Ferritin-like domain